MARQDNYPDALTGGAHIAAAAATTGGPMLLTPTHQLSGAVASYICARHGDIASAYIYGGPVAVDATVAEQLTATIQGDNCP